MTLRVRVLSRSLRTWVENSSTDLKSRMWLQMEASDLRTVKSAGGKGSPGFASCHSALGSVGNPVSGLSSARAPTGIHACTCVCVCAHILYTHSVKG